jgi:hypothetical protein
MAVKSFIVQAPVRINKDPFVSLDGAKWYEFDKLKISSKFDPTSILNPVCQYLEYLQLLSS